jgi:hypothetical protein
MVKYLALFLSFLALPALGAALVVSAVGAAAPDLETTLVVFDFQNATAGAGGDRGDRVVPASFLHHAAFISATFAWTDVDGRHYSFYDHGVQNWKWDDSADNVYSARGTGGQSAVNMSYSHFVITLAGKKRWMLTGFSMQQAGNEVGQYYAADIIAVQGKLSTVLGTVLVGGLGSPTVVSLSGLSYSVAEGPMQILIVPQVPSPTGSGFLAVDDINIMGRWNQ